MLTELQNSWNTKGYAVCNLVSADELQLILNSFRIFRYRHEMEVGTENTGDKLVPKSFSCYALPWFEALMLQVQPRLESIIGEEIIPGFSYARFYYPGATLPPHEDRPAAELSATMCLSVDPTPWPIWVQNEFVDATPLYLEPGQALVYKGLETKHWREEYKGNEQAQVFLHYVRKNGPHTEWAYDSRPGLGLPDSHRRKDGKF